MNPLAMLLTDGYKTGHHLMYPKGTSLVYSNFTPRSNKYAPDYMTQVVSFGQQMTMRMLHEIFRDYFFNLDRDEVIGTMKRELSLYLGTDYDVSHIEALYDLGYLPIQVKSLPEGWKVPMRVPLLTIKNTIPEFYWVTNYLETLLSNLLWKPITSATIAYYFRELLNKYARETDVNSMGFVPFQGHDFSMRGMDSIGATISSGLGHALSFMGSDSLPVVYGAREYYDHPESDPVIMSVNATEHSVMSAGTGLNSELETFERLLDTFPTGILSVVSDTFDLWQVCTEYLPQLKERILARDGKLVIRPDSGDPVDILCGEEIQGGGGGNHPRDFSHPKYKGVIELLWDTFGGTTNEQGYKCLDPHIGAIYGDSITLDRAREICERLKAKGFATSNVVLGIGSFTYQYNTRDTFGFAMKATYCEVEYLEGESGYTGEDPKEYNPTTKGIEIFKDPVTDDGIKKSAKGLLRVLDDDGKLYLEDQISTAEEKTGYLQTIYKDGQFENETTFNQVRQRLFSQGTL